MHLNMMNEHALVQVLDLCMDKNTSASS